MLKVIVAAVLIAAALVVAFGLMLGWVLAEPVGLR